ncbi:unnamed protein product, partial [Ectocarpus sp. 6 AP-2014]
MFLPRAAGAFMAESGKVDDESLSKEAPTKCPNYNVEDPTRRIWVFTTASLPWMTGTAVNPLLRAAYLTRGRDKGKVTLGVPWLVDEDQEKVYPKGKRYAAKEDQEAYVREWLVKAGLEEESKKLDILFYPARYHEQFGSIFPMGDLAAQAPDEEADVAVLEEPEHLNFFRAEGVPWLNKFNYVVGIIHTNYQFYARGEKHGRVKKPIVKAACAFTVRAHCHRIIKLSDALQGYAREKEMVENVHGVRPQFFEVGDEAVKNGFTGDAYFIGKVLWTKGIDILLALMHNARSPNTDESDVKPDAIVADAATATAAAPADTDGAGSNDPPPPPPPPPPSSSSVKEDGAGAEKGGDVGAGDSSRGGADGGEAKPFPIVIYGNGSDLDEVKEKVREMDLPVSFHDAIDHAELGGYKVFVNPSQSEVLCTTIAEALAMGKWVVCARHPSNEFFFSNFETCLSFSDEREFLSCMQKALSETPPRLSEETRHKLSWAAATDRFMAAASRPEVPGRNNTSKSARGLARLDKLLAALHQHTMKGKRGDLLRQAMGGGPVAKQNSFVKGTAAAAAAAAATPASASADTSPNDGQAVATEVAEAAAG